MEPSLPSPVERSSPCHTKEASIANPAPSRPRMFPLLSDIFEDVLPRDHNGLGFDDWPTAFEHAHAGFELGKALRAVVSILGYLHEKSPITITPATKALADGSRYGKFATFVAKIVPKQRRLLLTHPEPWRLLFGEASILDFYLDLLAAAEIEHEWTSDALRLVGNSCADLGSYRDECAQLSILTGL